MAVTRRDAIKSIGVAGVAPVLRLPSTALGPGESEGAEADVHAATLAAIADAVLPGEADKKAAVDAFTRWIGGYKQGADMDHGYGNTRIRATGPSPARNYPSQIAALDVAARAKGAANFAAAPLETRRAILMTAIADAKIDRLSARPTGAHVATDLMGHYFNSSAAAELCYRANIGRYACRGLTGSDQQPSPLRSQPPTSDPRS